MRQKLSGITLLVLILIMTGCGNSTELVENDSGLLLCVQERENPESESIESGVLLDLILFKECRANSLEDASCAVSVQGSEIVVISRLEYSREADQVVPAVCQPASVRCEIGELDGAYQIFHGDREDHLEVPSTDNLDCEKVRYLDELAPRPRRFFSN